MITRKQSDDIKHAWSLLKESVDNLSWGYSSAEKLLQQTTQETKDHNRGYIGRRGISQSLEARYFAVKRTVECLNGYVPNVSDYWHLQKSVFGAYGLCFSATTKDLVSATYQQHKELFDRVASCDYVDMMETK